MIIVLGLLLVAGAGLYYLVSNINFLVAGQIEKHGSNATGTAVRVSGVDIDLRNASAGLSGLRVANPDGYDGGSAIELGDFAVTIEPASLTKDTVVLSSVTVSGARLNLLQRGAASNLKELLDTLRSGSSDSGDGSGNGDGKKLRIDRFVLDGAELHVSAPDLAEDRTVALPRIVLTDIGRASGGATVAEAATQILQPVLQKTLQSAATQSIRQRAEDEIEKAKDSLLRGVLDQLDGSSDDDSSQN